MSEAAKPGEALVPEPLLTPVADVTVLVEPLERVSNTVAPLTASLNNLREVVEKREHSARRQWARAGKLLLVILPLLWGWEQYLEHNFETQRTQLEQEFTAATTQLSSESRAVRASAVRTIFELSFRDVPIAAKTTPYGPPINLLNWVRGRRELPWFDRGRKLLESYGRAERVVSNASEDLVSSAILQNAAEWRTRETQSTGTNDDSGVWLLYHANVSRAHAPSLELKGFQLAGANLSFADLQSADLSGANLQDAILEHANLESSKLLKAALLDVRNGTGARFTFANLQGVAANRASLDAADFSLSDLSRGSFDAANLARASFRTATARETRFVSANLANANFSGADLYKADFSKAVLDGADFRFANNLDQVASWSGASLRGTRFPSGFSIR